MALKLAKALGAEVTLFTRSPGKEQDARRLGADRIVLSTDAGQMASVTSHFDLIIDTVPSVHDINPYVPTLGINGTLVMVGYLGPLDPMLNSVPLIMGRKSVAGSLIGGIAETQEMLDFCGKHGITSDIEVIKIQGYQRRLRTHAQERCEVSLRDRHGLAQGRLKKYIQAHQSLNRSRHVREPAIRLLDEHHLGFVTLWMCSAKLRTTTHCGVG